MVFDLELYKRLVCGVQQNPITRHWELPEVSQKPFTRPYANLPRVRGR